MKNKLLILIISQCLFSCAPQKAGDLEFNDEPQASRTPSSNLPTNVTFKQLQSQIINPLGCVNCHGDMKSASGFHKYLKPGEPFDSKTYLRLENGTMPPFGDNANKEQLELLEAYIRELK